HRRDLDCEVIAGIGTQFAARGKDRHAGAAGAAGAERDPGTWRDRSVLPGVREGAAAEEDRAAARRIEREHMRVPSGRARRSRTLGPIAAVPFPRVLERRWDRAGTAEQHGPSARRIEGER